MTREEASTHLFDDWYIENGRLCVDESNRDDFCKALGAGIKSLRPVSREQMEKVWKGEWRPTEYPYMNECEDCSVCEYRAAWGHGFRFCPNCGAPMTDEAVQVVMERLEAVKDGSTAD